MVCFYVFDFFSPYFKSLAHLRHLGICHGDISLENFVVSRDGRVVLTDFGHCLRVPFVDRNNDIPRLIEPHGPRGHRLYMAPEILYNVMPFDGFAIDLWGAAIILYWLLVGVHPWESALWHRPEFRNVMNEPLPPDGEWLERLDQRELGRQMAASGRAISPLAADLLIRMLRRNPNERYTLLQVQQHPWMIDVAEENLAVHFDAMAVLELWRNG